MFLLYLHLPPSPLPSIDNKDCFSFCVHLISCASSVPRVHCHYLFSPFIARRIACRSVHPTARLTACPSDRLPSPDFQGIPPPRRRRLAMSCTACVYVLSSLLPSSPPFQVDR